MITEIEDVVLKLHRLKNLEVGEQTVDLAYSGQAQQRHAVSDSTKHWQRLSPPVLTRASLAWRNSLAACAYPLTFELDDGVYQLQLTPDVELKELSAEVVLQVSVDHHSCWLICSDFPLRAQLQAYLPATLLAELPDELRNAVIEAALAPLLEMTERVLEVPLQVTELAAQPPDIAEPTAIGFTLRAGHDSRVSGALLCEADLQPLLLQLFERWPAPPPTRWDWLRTSLLCEAGETRLTVAELAQLALGDVVLLERCRYLRDRSLIVRISPQWLAYAKFNAGKWVIEQCREEIITMEPNKPVVDTEALTVPLTFNIGELSLPFGELKQLQPGYAFELDRGMERLVTIHSHGQQIGVGELIQIDGRAGVRIVELCGQPDG